MKTKLFCRKCGEELLGDGGYCHCCRENKKDFDVKKLNFPDNPKNKVFLVDTYVTVCKCFRVEAPDKDAAQAEIDRRITEEMNGCLEADECRKLADMGFHYADEHECSVSGETDENGEERLY